MSKPTPGPWIVHDDFDLWDVRDDGAPGIPLFRADRGLSRSWGRKITRDELCANARLIAAAPELLSALEGLADAAAAVILEPTADSAMALNVATRQARAAIALATQSNEEQA